MTKPASEEARQKWKEHILKQRESSLSEASWCRQNNIDVHMFRYWRDKFFPKPPFARSAFKEISGIPKNVSAHTTGVSLECQGIYIHIDKQFDLLTLKQCLKMLKEMSC